MLIGPRRGFAPIRAGSSWTTRRPWPRQGVDTSVLVGHRQVTDLHLANLALASGGRLATFDRAITSWLAPRDRHLVHVIPT